MNNAARQRPTTNGLGRAICAFGNVIHTNSNRSVQQCWFPSASSECLFANDSASIFRGSTLMRAP